MRRTFSVLLACLLILIQAGSETLAQAQRSARPPLIRDTEIEGLMRLYTRPIFKAAGINPASVRVYIISDPRINAFVAGGQRIFIHTGLLSQTQSPNEVIGVLAHETGHIAGGHLARLGIELDRASVQNIVGMLVGAAAMVGGAVAGEGQAARAGQGVMMGSQGLAQRSILSYQRAMESAADQAALKYLERSGQSGQGMLSLFQKLANQSIASAQYVDPYVVSHPMPFERIRNLEIAAKKSRNFDKADSDALVLRHRLVQAKLAGFLQPPQAVFQKYPATDRSLPSRYARAISMFRTGDTKNAVALINGLIDDLPQNPYFWELKGQALLEGGNPKAAIQPLRQAVKLLPNAGLIQVMLAQALVSTENKVNAKEALRILTLAKKTETEYGPLYKFMAMAHGQLGDIARAELATAEAAWLQGDKEIATEKAKVAQKAFKTGSPEWLRANDILNFVGKD